MTSRIALKLLPTMALLPITLGLRAQSTTVTGQISDTSSISWANATVTAMVVPGTYTGLPYLGPLMWNGVSYPAGIKVGPVTASASGGYTITVPTSSAVSGPDFTRYSFLICPVVSGANCQTVSGQTVTGTTQTINFATLTPPLANGSTIQYAYDDSEIIGPRLGQIYYNLISAASRVFTAAGWGPLSSGGGVTLPTSSPLIGSDASGNAVKVTQVPGSALPAATSTTAGVLTTAQAGAAAPVQSVNSVTGAVSITAAGIGAVTPATAGMVNVLTACSVKGDGSTIDGPAIVSCLSANPTATIFFPVGTGNYLLNNNGVNSSGLTIPSAFHGNLVFAEGAKLACNTSTATAGQCINFTGNSGIRVDGLDLTFTTTTVLPRNAASPNNALIVQGGSADIRFNNPLIEFSPGVGFWNTGSDRITYSNARVTNTSADGMHFENCGDCGVDGYSSDNTGDDALAWTNIATTGVKTGGFGRNLNIRNSHARGVLDAGQDGVIVQGVYTNGTGYSGVAVIQDPSITTRIPANVIMSGVNVNHAGDGTVSVPAGTSGNNHCFDMGLSTGTQLSAIQGHYCGGDGLYAYSEAAGTQTALQVNNFQADHATGKGFEANTVTGLRANLISTLLDSGGGYSLQNLTNAELSNITSTSDTGYGRFVSGANNVRITNERIINDSATNNGLAIETESPSGPMTVDGSTLIDTRATAAGYRVGGYNIGAFPLRVTGLVNMVTDLTTNPFALSGSGGANESYRTQVATVSEIAQSSTVTVIPTGADLVTITLSGNYAPTWALPAAGAATTRQCIQFIQNASTAYTVTYPAATVLGGAAAPAVGKRSMQCFASSPSQSKYIAESVGITGY